MKPAKSKNHAKTPRCEIPIHCAYRELRATADLLSHQHPANPNKHPASQLEKYAAIIAGNGWRRAVTVSARSGYIVKGHGAVQAAALRGWKFCPVDVQPYASEALELADMAADNELARQSETDELALAKLLGSIKELDASLIDLTGLSEREIGNLAKEIQKSEERSFDNDITDKIPNEREVYIVPIALTRKQFSAWQARKDELGNTRDKDAFMKIASL